jgi:hypothetical protein
MSGIEFIGKDSFNEAKKKLLNDFYLSYSDIEKAHPDQWKVVVNYNCWKPHIFRDYREFKLDELYADRVELISYLREQIRTKLMTQFKYKAKEENSMSELLDVYHKLATTKWYVAGGNEYELDLWSNEDLNLLETLWIRFGLPSIPEEYKYLTQQIQQCYQSLVESDQNQTLIVAPYAEVKSTCDYEGTSWWTGFSGRILTVVFDQTTLGVLINDKIHV